MNDRAEARRPSLLRATLCLVLIASSGLSASAGTVPLPEPAAGKPRGRIGVLAYRGPQEVFRMWGPTADHLNRSLPAYPFSVVPLDFRQIGPAVERGEVDFILANSSIYVELEARYGITRIATLRNRTPRGPQTLFGGVIFRRADRTDVPDLDGLAGRSFAAVDETSLGGWQVAWRELKDRGIDPYEDLGRLEFLGTHDAVVYAVRDGRVDAGTVRTDVLERMAGEGKIALDAFTVLNRQEAGRFPFLLSTRLYPEWPFAKLPATPDTLATQVAVALMQVPADSAAALAGRIEGWTTPLDYHPVHDLMKELRIGPYRDFGRITLGMAVRRYWYWVASAAVVIALLLTLSLRLGRLNRRLRRSRQELERARTGLEEEVQARTEELRQSETRFRSLVEQSLVGIYIIRDGRFLYVNPRLAEMFGYDRPEEIVLSRTVAELVAPESRPLVAENIRKRLQGEIRSLRYAFQGLKKDGAVIEVEVFGSRTEIDGAPAIIGTILDVTEQKSREQERLEAQRFLQSVIDGVQEHILVIAPDHRVVLMNRPARSQSREAIYCFSISHHLDGPCADADHPCPLEAVLATKKPATVTHRHRKNDGSELHMEILASPIFDSAGNAAYVVEVCRDITEKIAWEELQKKMQERLYQQQKERSITTLAGGIAHNFNNLLMGVLGYAEMLKARLPAGTPDQASLDTIIELSRRMARLSHQLLDYARQGPQERRVIEPAVVVRQAVNLVRAGSSDEAEISHDMAEGLWNIWADPARIGQVITNILMNAIESLGAGGGRIMVRAENLPSLPAWDCPHGRHAAGDYVRISVTDTGPGMPPDVLQRIFEPFFTTKFLGRGLGLATAMGIVQTHGGCITARSEPGKGSLFQVSLPRHIESPREREAPRPPSPRGAVLVVDDEPEVLSHLRTMLDDLGYEALAAKDSAGALDLFDRRKSDLLLAVLDLQLAGEDAVALCRALKRELPGLKVLISSGYDERTALARFGGERPDGFIQKPYWTDALREKIAEVLGRPSDD